MIKNFKSFVSKGMRAAKLPLAVPLSNGFHSSQAYNKKLDFGETLAVLEEKISKISQLVRPIYGILWTLLRTTSKNSVPLSPSVMVLPEFSVSPRSKPVKWLSSPLVSEVWLLTWKLTTSVSSSWVTIGEFVFPASIDSV